MKFNLGNVSSGSIVVIMFIFFDVYERFMECKNSFFFPVDQRSSNSSSNIFKLLIDEQPMTSKYWTSSHKSSVNRATPAEQKEALIEADSTSFGESMEEDIVTIKASNMENGNSAANLPSHQHETTKHFSISNSAAASIKRRPDSLKLSFDYGSSSDLAKSATSNVDVNQSKSLSVTGNNSHHDGKKSTSYDLWVNENVGLKERSGSGVTGETKKLDLPGRVSFR